MLRYRLAQQTRVSQQDYIQVEDVFLVPIYISLSEEAARDAEVVGEADAVVDGDRPRARLDLDRAAPGWLRRAHGLFSGEVAPPLLRRRGELVATRARRGRNGSRLR